MKSLVCVGDLLLFRLKVVEISARATSRQHGAFYSIEVASQPTECCRSQSSCCIGCWYPGHSWRRHRSFPADEERAGGRCRARQKRQGGCRSARSSVAGRIQAEGGQTRCLNSPKAPLAKPTWPVARELRTSWRTTAGYCTG